MGSDRAERVLEEAREKERRIDAALTAIAALKPDEAAFVYARLEKLILAATDTGSSGRAPERTPKPAPSSPRKKKSAKRPVAKKPKDNKYAAKTPSLTSRAEQLLHAHPEGMRTYEIAQALGRKSNAVGVLMRLLQSQGKAQRQGNRLRTLWFVPGTAPVPRILTADDAILQVLETGPMGPVQLEKEAGKVLLRALGREMNPISITSRFGKLLSKKLIVHHAADEHGPIYALADDEAEGGEENAAPTIN